MDDYMDSIDRYGREHIALVVRPQLLACNAKRRARHAARDQIDIAEGFRLEVADVLLHHVPVRAVQPQGRTELRFILDDPDMMEPGPFETEGLPTAAGAKFEGEVAHAVGSGVSFKRCAAADTTHR